MSLNFAFSFISYPKLKVASKHRVWASRAGRALKKTRMKGSISHSKACPILTKKEYFTSALGSNNKLKMMDVIKHNEARLKTMLEICGIL